MKEKLDNRLKNIMRVGFLFLALVAGAILGTAFKLSGTDGGTETVGGNVTQGETEYSGTEEKPEGLKYVRCPGTAIVASLDKIPAVHEKLIVRREAIAKGGNGGQSQNGSQGQNGNGSQGEDGNGGSSQGQKVGEGSQNGSSGGSQGQNGAGGGNSQGGTGGAAPQAGHPSASGALQVKGTQLCDSKGNPIQLRGISTHGLAWYPDYVNEALFAQLRKEWNVNVVRLAMYTAEYGGYCTGGDPAKLKQLVKNGVRYATNQDLYVIIDWHILSDSNPNSHKNEAKAFFQEMSQNYASYSNVIYEICNEPNGGTSWKEIKSYANEIIPVIRANDPDALILVGTPNWSQYVDQAAADPLTGYSNIMYTLHFYADTHRDSLRNTMVSAINAGLPVFVSEYGICDASGGGAINEAQANAWVGVMDQYGVSYVAWNMSNKNETCSIFKSSCSKTSGFTQEDLSSSGKWLYSMLTNGSGGMAAGGGGSGSSGGGGNGGGSGSSGGGGNGGGSGSSGGGNGGSSGSSGGGGNGGGSGSSGSGGSVAASHVLKNSEVEINVQMLNSWQSGDQSFYQYSITLKNTSGSASTGWAIDVQFNENISLSNGWNGNYSVSGSTLHITSMDYNGGISAGGTTGDIGFIVSGSSALKIK